jgi:synaptotagmin-7
VKSVRALTLPVFFIADPYVKVWLQFGDKRIEKRKTAIFKCTLNPVFNDTFSFNVPWEKIRECSLDVMVMDFDNIGRNELIGRILLAGMKRKRLRYVSVCNLRNA